MEGFVIYGRARLAAFKLGGIVGETLTVFDAAHCDNEEHWFTLGRAQLFLPIHLDEMAQCISVRYAKSQHVGRISEKRNTPMLNVAQCIAPYVLIPQTNLAE